MGEVAEAGHKIGEGIHGIVGLIGTSIYAEEAIKAERAALLSGNADSEEKEIIEKAERSRAFWNRMFCAGMCLGFPMFTAFLVLWIIYFTTVYLVFFVISVVMVIAGIVGGAKVMLVAKKLKKDLRMRRCKTGGYLLKSTIPEDQWYQFHYFDSVHRMKRALLINFILFVCTAAGGCIGIAFADVPKIIFAYIVLGCFAFFTLLFLTMATWVLVRRSNLMKETDREVFLFRDSAIYHGFFLDWNTIPRGHGGHGAHMQVGVYYLKKAKIAKDESAGPMLMFDVFTVNSKNQRNDTTFFVPIAEADLAAAQNAVNSVV